MRISGSVAVSLLPVVIAATFCAAATVPAAAQYPPWYSGQSVVWQPAQSPYTPGPGAIMGGPGADPNPGSSMYICHARYRGGVVPGKWVQGSCNIPYGGQEILRSNYEVAYGSAYWQPYQNNPYGLLQTGTAASGMPLYSCRVHYTGGFPPADLGYQPGKIVGGNCNFPLGGQEIVQQPPFEALYAGGGYYPGPPPPSTPPPVVYPDAGPSSVTWTSESAPFTPEEGAVEGGPGDGPQPGAPLYICRGGYGGDLIPGKWIQGKCSISYGGRELKTNTYDVAYGPASWQPFDGYTSSMVRGGYQSDGTPLYICRVPHFNFWFKDRGSQPGKLLNGICLVPYGGSEIPTNPPFQALYSDFSQQEAAPVPPPPPGPAAPENPAGGMRVSFLTGTAAGSGTLAMTNGATNKTVTKHLAPNLSPSQCVLVLQQAAFEAGLQIQAEPDGKGLRIFGKNNVVSVTGAAISMSQF